MINISSSAALTPPSAELPGIQQLLEIIAILRGPGGCPWDREQTHDSLRAGVLEEAYEVVSAIDARDDPNLREELGDLLLQTVFHAQLATEEGRFTFDDVAREVAAKLVRRHPHVFRDTKCADAAEVLQRWDEMKRREKGERPQSALDGVPLGLPALMRAEKVQKKAAQVGFDWSDTAPVFDKVREELMELEASAAVENSSAVDSRELPEPSATGTLTKREGRRDAVEDELGDVLFAAVNLARKLDVDPEVALHAATTKFAARFRDLEQLAVERGLAPEKMALAELDALWEEVKGRRSKRAS